MSTKITSMPTGDNKINSQNTIIAKDTGNLVYPIIFRNPETGEDYPEGVYPTEYSSKEDEKSASEESLIYPIIFDLL